MARQKNVILFLLSAACAGPRVCAVLLDGDVDDAGEAEAALNLDAEQSEFFVGQSWKDVSKGKKNEAVDMKLVFHYGRDIAERGGVVVNKTRAYQTEVLKPLIFASWLAYAKGGRKVDPAPFLMDAIVPIEWAGFGIWKRDRKWETNDPEIMSVVLADPNARTAIVAFRGACLAPDLPNCGNNLCSHEMFDTQMKAEFLTDYQCSPVEFGAVVRRTEKYLDKLRQTLGRSYKFMVTGHSIGGALAMSLDRDYVQVISFDPAPYWMMGSKQAPVFSTRLWNRIAIMQPLTIEEQQLYNPAKNKPTCPEDAHTCSLPISQPPQSCLRCHDQIEAGKKDSTKRKSYIDAFYYEAKAGAGIHDMVWAQECINDPKYYNERYGMSKCKHDLGFISRFAEVLHQDAGHIVCEVVCSVKRPSIERDHPIQLGIENAAGETRPPAARGAEPGIDGQGNPSMQVLKDTLSEGVKDKIRSMDVAQATAIAAKLKNGGLKIGKADEGSVGALTGLAATIKSDKNERVQAAVIKKAAKAVEEKKEDTKKALETFQQKTRIAKSDRSKALRNARGALSRGMKSGKLVELARDYRDSAESSAPVPAPVPAPTPVPDPVPAPVPAPTSGEGAGKAVSVKKKKSFGKAFGVLSRGLKSGNLAEKLKEIRSKAES